MAYEYEDFIDAMRLGLTMSDRDTTDDIWNMVDEVVNKAKALDKVITIVEDKEEFYSNEFIEAVVSAVDEFIDYELEDE